MSIHSIPLILDCTLRAPSIGEGHLAKSNLPVSSKVSDIRIPRPTDRQEFLTYEPEILAHWISDEELEKLSELRSDHVVEFFWGFLGIALGSAVPAYLLMSKIGSSDDPIGKSDLFTICTFIVFTFLTGIMGFWWRKRHKSSEDLKNRIRNRPKVPVGGPDGPIVG